MAVLDQTLIGLVLQNIREGRLRPTELVRKLSSEAYPREVENALSVLIEDGAVVFGTDGILHAL